MGRRGQGKAGRTLAAAAAFLAVVPFATAQVADGGKTLRLTLGQTLSYSDNIELVSTPAENTLRSSTALGLSYSDVTRNQRLEFSARATYEIDNGDDGEFADPFARLSYALQGANTRLGFSAEYRQVDLDDISIPLSLLLPGVILPDEIVNDVAQIETGVRTDTSYTLEFETGLRSTVGFSLELFARDRRYDELQIFNLSENTVISGTAETIFRFSPSLTARIIAQAQEFESEDEDDSRRLDTTLGVSLSYDVTPSTELDVFVGQQRIERDLDGSFREVSGARFLVGLTRDMPNGNIAVDFTTEPTLNGRDSVFRVSREQTLVRGGELAYGIGVSETDDLGVEPLYRLSYLKPLRRGRFDLSLNQQVRGSDSTAESVILTDFSLGYGLELTPRMNFSVRAGLQDVAAQRDDDDRRSLNLRSDLGGRINEISSWTLSATFQDSRSVVEGVDRQQRRYGVQMAYRRALTRDWNVIAQYEHASITETEVTDRRSNTISLGIERNFDTRF